MSDIVLCSCSFVLLILIMFHRNAWSKSKDWEAVKRCEAILKRMEGLALEGRTELQPDTVSFNTVIDALAQSGQRGAPQRAEVLLQRMETLAKDLSFPCEPDTFSFNIVINSWAKVGRLWTRGTLSSWTSCTKDLVFAESSTRSRSSC